MTLPPAQIEAVRKVAEKYGVPEFNREDRKGIFYEPVSKVIIDCQHLSKEFTGLPTIGISNLIDTDENAGGNTIDSIRSDIQFAFDGIPKEPKKKTAPRVEFDSKARGNAPDKGQFYKVDPVQSFEVLPVKEAKGESKSSEYDTHKEIMDDVKKLAVDIGMVPKPPEPDQKKSTIPVKMCAFDGFALPPKRAEECYRIEEAFTCNEDCAEKLKAKLMEKSKETVPLKGRETEKVMNESIPKEPEKQPETPLTPTANILEYIRSYVNNDVLEIFGDSGTGKSKFAVEVARQTIAAGKTVFYLDTERNLSKEEVEKLKGCQYKYTPLISEISSITRTLPKVDLVIVDSIGFPILTAYARMNMKQKGDAFLNMIAIFGDLKEWAYRNNSIAIVINQPESDFNKEPGHLIRPFGDKSQFAAKEIWKTEVTQRGSVTKSTIQAFRSRSVGHKTMIATMEVSNSGTIIKGAKA